jgi:hypothetical protein
MSHLHLCCLELVDEGGQRPARRLQRARGHRAAARSLPVPLPHSSAASKAVGAHPAAAHQLEDADRPLREAARAISFQVGCSIGRAGLASTLRWWTFMA